MTLLAMCCVAASIWLWFPQPRRARTSPASSPDGDADKRSLSWFVESAAARAAVCIAGLALLGQLFAGTIFAVAGVPAGIALSVWLGRLESPSAARAREEIDRDLPLAADLLAACASVGRAPQESLPIVSRAVGAALGARLRNISMRLALGADPVDEWARLARDPQLGDLGRTMLRSVEYGAPLAESLSRLAEDRRRERRTTTQLRARSVGVKAAGPLALCFLPAFMLVGIVPTVAGAFRNLFG